MRITDIPQSERPREKLLRYGVNALSNSELLAILLRHGCKPYSAIEIAQQLLQQCGSLRNLFNLTYQEFSKIKGLGLSHFTQLQASLALAQRLLEQELPEKIYFDQFKSLEKYLLSKLSMQEQEVFAVLFLTSKLELIAYEELFRGSINFTTVHPREVMKRALIHNAAALILAHNHPSGDPTPSKEDYHLTEVLQECLKWLDVKIIQHIVVGHKRCQSILL